VGQARAVIDLDANHAAARARGAHTSLEDVMKNCRILKPEDGLRYLPNNEATKFLAGRMLCHGLMLKPPKNFAEIDVLQITKTDLLSWKAILSVPSKKFECGQHAVAWCPITQKVFDPLLDKPQDLSQYPEVIDWTPIGFLAGVLVPQRHIVRTDPSTDVV